MKLRKSVLSAAILVSFISAGSYANADGSDLVLENGDRSEIQTPIFGPIIISNVKTMILSSAKSSIKSNLKSLFTSALFGNSDSGLTREVDLSQNSLDQIKNIVKDSNVKIKISEFKSELQTLEDLIVDYRAVVGSISDQQRYQMHDTLNQLSTQLINHPIFNDSYYKSHRMMLTNSYALVVSLRVAVLTERYLNGSLKGNIDYINHARSEMLSRLMPLGHESDRFIGRSIIAPIPSSGCGSPRSVDMVKSSFSCKYGVRDNISGSTSYHWTQGQAMAKRNNLIRYYKSMYKGSDYSDFVTKLGEDFDTM